MFFGINIILWSKLNGRPIVYLYNKAKKFGKPITQTELDEELKKLLPCEYESIFYVNNLYALNAPTAIIKVNFNNLYRKYKYEFIDELFPYLFEPVPFAETYRNTTFYKDLYINKLPYKGLSNISAKVLFQSQLLFNGLL
jgi:hypothetical protein